MFSAILIALQGLHDGKEGKTKSAKPAAKSPPVAIPTTARPAKYPRHSVEKALRIPKAILEQNGGHASTLVQAAGYLGLTNPKGPFAVDIGSAKKFGFLDSPEQGKIHPTELARRILRPKSSEDQLEAFREAVLQAPDIADVYKHYRGENIPQDTFLRTPSSIRSGYRKPISRISSKYSSSHCKPRSSRKNMARIHESSTSRDPVVLLMARRNRTT